jgi:glycosyltransferase involved in cell wall biosynthesis
MTGLRLRPQEPMKIVFYHELLGPPDCSLTDVFDGSRPTSGGMGRIKIACHLARAGHDVTVFHHLPGPEGEAVIVRGVRAVRARDVTEFVDGCAGLTVNDAIVVNVFDAFSSLGERLRQVPAVKIVWAGVNVPFEWCDALDQDRFHRLVCVSDTSRNFYRLHARFDFVESIYTCFDFPVPAPADVTPDSVAFLGALREEKGFQHVLSAWPLVRLQRPNAVLSVFGSIRLHFPEAPVGATGVLTPDFETKYLRPILPPSGDWRDIGIHFRYPSSKEELYRALTRTCVGVVNPSLTGSIETYCLSAVEMQACGCPCIGGGIGGLLETIRDDFSGYHLRGETPNELAEKIGSVLANAALRERLRRGALAHSRLFASPEREVRDWLAVIDRGKLRAPSPRRPDALLDFARWAGLGRARIHVNRFLSQRPAAMRAARSLRAETLRLGQILRG